MSVLTLTMITFLLARPDVQRTSVLVLLRLGNKLGFQWINILLLVLRLQIPLWILHFQNCSWRFCGNASLLHHSPSVNALWGQKEPGIKEEGGKGNISWALGAPEGLQCPQESWRHCGHSLSSSHSRSRPLGLPQAAAARGIKPQLAVRLGWEFCVYNQAGLLPGLNNHICLTQKQEEPREEFTQHVHEIVLAFTVEWFNQT